MVNQVSRNGLSKMKQLDELLELPKGSVLRRVDLHVHSPASGDMDNEWQDSTPDDLVEMALGAGLDAIAITDHNTAAWCDRVREAANGTGLAVFPGVELSTSEGHLLAIFDIGKPQAEIEEFLVNVGIRKRDFGKTDKNADGRIDEVARRIQEEGGLAIAAHVEREKGFWSVMETSKTRRKEIHGCEEIRAYEIVDPSLRETFMDGSLPGYARKVACVQGSDSFPPNGERHQLDAIGHRHCLIAFDDISLTGLRLAFFDPDVRICFVGDGRATPSSAIEGLWVSGGFLENQLFRLSDNITCFIGDTGSGKSLSLELLRYGLGQQVNVEVLPKIATEVADLLETNLQPLDTVSVVIRKGEDLYLVERPWLVDDDPPDPTVSRLVDGVPEELEPIHLPSFFPIKGFSQTEIIEYAREPLARLSLIDDLIELDAEEAEIEELKGLLRQNATDTVSQYHLVEKSEEALKALPGIREEIDRLKTFLTNEKVRKHALWAAERGVLKSVLDTIGRLEESVNNEFPTLGDRLLEDDDLDEETPSPNLQDELKAVDAEIRAALSKSRTELVSVIGEHKARVQEIEKEWSERFDVAEKEYRELLAQLDTDERSQATLQAKLTKLETKVRELRATERKLKKEIRPRLQELEESRETLLTKLQRTRGAMTRKRRAKAGDLTNALDRSVVIKIRTAEDSREFLRELIELRRGSHVQESDLEKMAEELHPVPLVKSLLTGDFKTPAEKADLEPHVLERYMQNIVEKGQLNELFELQIVDLSDGVDVQFAIDDQTYRDLERLAHGQKCTVVLMIALAEGDFPLLVDQPEDALHAPWIENYIASTLRNNRGSRQSVFATRNANVLVSADAEQIIAMKADADSAVVDKTGALDRFDTRDLVLYHVEGGQDSFLRRQAKYGLDT